MDKSKTTKEKKQTPPPPKAVVSVASTSPKGTTEIAATTAVQSVSSPQLPPAVPHRTHPPLTNKKNSQGDDKLGSKESAAFFLQSQSPLPLPLSLANQNQGISKTASSQPTLVKTSGPVIVQQPLPSPPLLNYHPNPIFSDPKLSFMGHGDSSGLKQSIFGGSSYSKALLRGKMAVENESLKFLEGTHHLFFRKCKSFPPEISSFNPKNKRGIWNASGRVVYYTGTKKSFLCKGCHYSGFVQEVVDYSGNTVIYAQGRQFLFGLTSAVEISLENGSVLGTMHQSCLSSTYEIKDTTGRLIYTIQAPCFAPCAPFVFWCCKEQFEICMDDGVTEIGKITKYWGSDVDAPEFRSCLGIEMERADDVRVKALLLGCFFLIEFQYYKCGGNGPIYFFLMLLIFAGIVAISECVGYCPFWQDKAVEKVEIM